MWAGLDAAVLQAGSREPTTGPTSSSPNTSRQGHRLSRPNRSAQAAATGPTFTGLEGRSRPEGEQRDVGLHGDDNHVSSIRQTRAPEKAAGAQPEPEPRLLPGAGRKSTLEFFDGFVCIFSPYCFHIHSHLLVLASFSLLPARACCHQQLSYVRKVSLCPSVREPKRPAAVVLTFL